MPEQGLDARVEALEERYGRLEAWALGLERRLATQGALLEAAGRAVGEPRLLAALLGAALSDELVVDAGQ